MGKFNKNANVNLLHIISDILFAMLAYELAVISTCTYNYLERGVFALPVVEGARTSEWPMLFYFLIAVGFTALYVLVAKEGRLYNVTTFFYSDRIVQIVSRAFIFALLIESMFVFYLGNARIDTQFYLMYLIYTYVLLLLSAFLARKTIKKSNRFSARIILVGNIKSYEKFITYLDKGNTDYNLIGYVSEWPCSDERYLGSLSQLEEIIHKNGIDQVYMMRSNGNGIDYQFYLNHCMEMGVIFRLIMNEIDAPTAHSYVSSIGTYPVETWHTVSLDVWSRAVKRVMDIAGSLLGLIAFSPIMLITAIAIKLDSPGPVIFKQERVGKNGRHFFMYKFRSMCNNADAMKKQLEKQNEMADGFMFKMENDPRITKVGRFIRKTSIDELPQFVNVLLGSMSLVGTRPPTLDEVAKYERNHWRRMSIKPGITGMWQVSGRSSIKDFNEIVRLDTDYIDHWNVFMDIRILFLTVVKVFKHDGAC